MTTPTKAARRGRHRSDGEPRKASRIATISVPESRMLSVQVWDRSQVQVVDKAIRAAGLGLNPVVDGALIRIPRITHGRYRSTRCELRCPDPSSNPYLAGFGDDTLVPHDSSHSQSVEAQAASASMGCPAIRIAVCACDIILSLL